MERQQYRGRNAAACGTAPAIHLAIWRQANAGTSIQILLFQMNLYHELLTLTGDQSPARNPEGAKQAIEIAALSGTPDQFRREMRDKTAHFILPEIPDGCEFSRDCFWWDFQIKLIWYRAWMGTTSQQQFAADWLRTQRETAQKRGQAWPPKPTFRPVARPVPQPWDGREERPGRVPRTGK